MQPTLGVDLTTVDTTQKHVLGTRVTVDDPDYGHREFIYVKGVASCVLGSWLVYDEAFATALMAATTFGGAGVAMAALIADTYGWIQIFGSAQAKMVANVADNADLWTCGTAGSADDAATTAVPVIGAVAREAVGGAAAVATVSLAYPKVIALS